MKRIALLLAALSLMSPAAQAKEKKASTWTIERAAEPQNAEESEKWVRVTHGMAKKALYKKHPLPTTVQFSYDHSAMGSWFMCSLNSFESTEEGPAFATLCFSAEEQPREGQDLIIGAGIGTGAGIWKLTEKDDKDWKEVLVWVQLHELAHILKMHELMMRRAKLKLFRRWVMDTMSNDPSFVITFITWSEADKQAWLMDRYNAHFVRRNGPNASYEAELIAVAKEHERDADAVATEVLTDNGAGATASKAAGRVRKFFEKDWEHYEFGLKGGGSHDGWLVRSMAAVSQHAQSSLAAIKGKK